MSARLEWRLARANRRLFLFNATVPLLLVAPVALGGAPPAHAAIVYTLLFTFFGIFGAAIPLARDAHARLLDRYLLAGWTPRRWTAERVAAHAAIDCVQLATALIVIIFAARAPTGAALVLAATAAAALLAGNAIGAAVAAAARSFAETALLATLTALLLAHAAGVFRTPAPGSMAERIRPVLPFSHLHDAVRAALGTAPATDTSATAATASALAIFALIVAAAPLLLSRLRSAARA